MPQSGTSVSIEAIDPVFQMKFVEALKQTGRQEAVVGWYHSHPGFGCWLSNTDCNTQQSFEQLDPRAVGVVIDPIQSVRGKVVIDAFRLIKPNFAGQEPRQTTSNVGHLVKPSISALIHGLNRHYYSLNIAYRKNELEAKMLLNVHSQSWRSGLATKAFEEHSKKNALVMKQICKLVKDYDARVVEEGEKTSHEIMVASVGKVDAKRHLVEQVDELLATNVNQLFALGLESKTL